MTSTLAVAAVLVLAAEPAAPPPFKADAQALFDGCRAKADGPTSRRYSCRDWGAAIANTFMQVQADRKQQRDLVRAGMVAMLPGEVNEQVFEAQKIGSRTTDVLRLTPKGEAKWGFGVGATVELAPGRQRVVMCSARKLDDASTKRCREALAYLLDTGTPDDVDISTPPFSQEPVLLGRKLTVPAGCKAQISAEGVGRILCDDSLVSWTVIPDSPDPMKHAVYTAQGIARVQGLTLATEKIDCVVDGKPGKCLELSGLDSHYVGARLEGTSSLVVSCGSNDPKVPFKPVCDGLLSLPKPRRL